MLCFGSGIRWVVKPWPVKFGSSARRDAHAGVEAETNLHRHDLADVGGVLGNDQLRENEFSLVDCVRAAASAPAARVRARIRGDVQRQRGGALVAVLRANDLRRDGEVPGLEGQIV